MLGTLRNLWALSWSRKRLLVEAAWELLRAAWLVRRRQFQSYANTLGQPSAGEFEDIAGANMPSPPLGEVRWALRRVNLLVGGRFTCLMLAMAGKRILNRRGLANTLVLGVRPNAGAGKDPIGAHAWLRAGPFVVIGLEESAGHIPVASYHSDPSLR